MDPLTVQTIKKKRLEADIAALSADYASVAKQWRSTTSELDRNRLDRQLQDIESQMEARELELKALESNIADPNRLHLEALKVLPQIDYKKSIRLFKDIYGQFGPESGAALFLLQNSNSMAGHLFTTLVLDFLKSETSDLKHYQLEFMPPARLDMMGILNGLGRHVGVDVVESEIAYAQLISQKLYGALLNGSIVFIELRRWNYLQPQDRILHWFVEQFWEPLVGQLPEVCLTRREVRIIGLISTETTLPLNCQSLCCDENQFDRGRPIELPLENWTREEILRWLSKYSKLRGLSSQEIEQAADQIYRASLNGIPRLACDKLLEFMT